SAQRQLTPNMLIDVAYVGNHSLKLLLFADINQARPNNPGENASLQARRPISTFSAISTGFPVGLSNYHGLQVKFERRMNRGLYVLNSFTWSKAIDNVSQALEDPNGNSANPQNFRNLRAERGLSAYDQPFNNTTSVVWEAPIGKGRKWGSNLPTALDYFVGGWGVSAINQLTSGQVINLRYTSIPAAYQVTAALAPWQGGVSFRPNIYGDIYAPKDQRTIDNYFNRATVFAANDPAQPGGADPSRPFGSAGRNIGRSHAFYQLDLGLHKSVPLPINETTRVEFRAEFFNLLNKTNFRAANPDRSSAAFGRISSTFPARQIQFALKVVF
ncbi:MAG: TonB-dependent receptor, partial [Blastocatellia bacterium]